jgi:hypothetical protein
LGSNSKYITLGNTTTTAHFTELDQPLSSTVGFGIHIFYYLAVVSTTSILNCEGLLDIDTMENYNSITLNPERYKR